MSLKRVFLTMAMICLLCCDGNDVANRAQSAGGQSPEEPARTESTAVPASANWPDEVLALVIEGRHSEATALLLDGTPPASGVVIPEFVNLSEMEFQALPRDVATKLMQAMPGISDGLMNFSKDARTAIQNTSDSATRQLRADRLKEFGRDLSGEDRLALFKLIGNAIEGWGL